MKKRMKVLNIQKWKYMEEMPREQKNNSKLQKFLNNRYLDFFIQAKK